MKKWEHFQHTADIGIRGISDSLPGAFEMAATALIAVITDPGKLKPERSFTVMCEAGDYDYLFFEWINTIVYEIEMRKMLFSGFDLTIEGFKLTAVIKGETIKQNLHRPAVDIKGATLTELKVEQKNGIWTAQCVVDV